MSVFNKLHEGWLAKEWLMKCARRLYLLLLFVRQSAKKHILSSTLSSAQSAGATCWVAREKCCSRGRWCRSSSDSSNFIKTAAAPTKLDLLRFVFIFIFFNTEPKVTSPGSTLWQNTDSLLLRKLILLLISLVHQNWVDTPCAPAGYSNSTALVLLDHASSCSELGQPLLFSAEHRLFIRAMCRMKSSWVWCSSYSNNPHRIRSTIQRQI